VNSPRIGSHGLLGVVMTIVSTTILAIGAHAQPSYPTPGGAAGSDTGDSPAAYAGLAPAPQAHAFSGVAQTAITIEVPPGRLGATPSLRLTYSSDGGSGAYGTGWNLALPRIVRSTRHGVPRYESSDEFVLQTHGGAVELEPITGTPRYRAKVEREFLRIGFDEAANRWKVFDKSGNQLIFGQSPSTRTGPQVSLSSGTYAWLLERSIDPFGNHIDYEYLTASGRAHGAGLPSVVRYGGNAKAGLAHAFAVHFTWSSPTYPPVPRTTYEAGFAVVHDRLLQTIETAIETAAETRVVRRYQMSHAQDPAAASTKLVGVTLEGFAEDPDRDVSLPTTVFEYAPSIQTGYPIGSEASRLTDAVVLPSPGGLRKIGGSVRFDTFDIDGDSLVDYVQVGDAIALVRLGTGAGFAAPIVWPWPSNARKIQNLGNEGSLDLSVFDLTGDGLPDLVDARAGKCAPDAWCVYVNTGEGFDPAPVLWPAPNNHIRTVGGSGNRVRKDTIDLNGDGLPDWVDATTYQADAPFWTVHWNTGTGFETTGTSVRAPRDLLGRTKSEDSHYFFVYGVYDMNDDGLPDFVDAELAAPGSWSVYFNTGAGFAEEPLAWRIDGQPDLLPDFISETDSNASSRKTYSELIDMTGDGLPDWLRPWSPTDALLYGLARPACDGTASQCGTGTQPPTCCSSLLLFVNTGTSFSAPVSWPAWDEELLRSYSENPSASEREFDVFDFDGDGLLDLVEIADDTWRVFLHPASPAATGSPTPPHLRSRPDSLVAMLNGVGGETRLVYTPTAADPATRLPFPHWVLRRREIYDGYTTEAADVHSYSYGDALYVGARREFRGFGRVWETDAGGRTSLTYFHQDTRRKGLVHSVATLAASGCAADDPRDQSDPCSPGTVPLRLDENDWSDTGPVLLLGRTSTPFFGTQPIPELGKAVTLEYDLYGNVTRETIASPSAATVITTTHYGHREVIDASGQTVEYLVDKPLGALTVETSADDRPLGEKRFTYDLGAAATGALERSETCIDWNDGQCARWSTTSYEHDGAGNVTKIVGPRGRPTTMAYDELRLYALETRNAAGLTTRTIRDRADGKARSTTDVDGRTFETRYDGLGRPVRSWRDGFTEELPEIVARYVDGVPGLTPSRVETDQYGVAPTVVFFDGLGRRVATKTSTSTAVGPVTVVSGLRRYSPIGTVLVESASQPAADPSLQSLRATIVNAQAVTTHRYDEQGRLVESILPDGSTTRFDASVPGVRVVIHANLVEGTHPGSATIELLDGLGRVWRRDVCSGVPVASAPMLCPAGTLEVRDEYEHDGLDRPIRIDTGVNTATPATTSITYDGLGNRVTVSSSDLGTWSYHYTDDGLLGAAADPRGVEISNSYDRLGRLRKQRTDGFKASYAYHKSGPGTGKIRRVRSKRGRARVSKSFAYDARARVVEESWTIRADAPTRRFTFHYGYDLADRRTAVSYPSSTGAAEAVLETGYDDYGRATSLHLYEAGTQHTIVDRVDYDLFGNPTRIDYGNGLSDRFRFGEANDLARLLCIRTTTSFATGNGCDADASDYRRLRIDARDPAGNVTAIEDLRFPAGSALNDSHTFSYDALGRLTDSTRPNGSTERFAYTASGNLAWIGEEVVAYDPATPHLPFVAGSQGIGHDAAGNRVRKGEWFYTYDPLGRLEEVYRGQTLQERYAYDEGQFRVARASLESGRTRYYFGGLFEIDGDAIVRHYHLDGRLIASERTGAPQGLALTTAAASDIRLLRPSTAIARPTVASVSSARRRASTSAVILLLVVISLIANCWTNRRRIAILTTTVFTTALLVPLSPVRPGRMLAHAQPAPIGAFLYYHSDHLGSPHMLTNAAGFVVEHRRHASYGATAAVLDANGRPLPSASDDVAFTGKNSSRSSGLVYFGARFYDPEIGMFLTPDPQAQFASPYLYGGGNPVDGIDPDGEFFGFLLAALQPIVLAATATAMISGVATGLQGGDFADGFTAGLVAGAIGAAAGATLGGLNVAYQYGAGGAEFIEAGEALASVVEVARRAAFTNVVQEAATTVADVAGLDSDWRVPLGLATSLVASYAYDNFIIKDSGVAVGRSPSQREMAKEGMLQVNTSIGHANVTAEAAVGTGWERISEQVARENLAEDGSTGVVEGAWMRLNNQDHFGRLPSTLDKLRQAATVAAVSKTDGAVVAYTGTTHSIGAASHYVQDHLTLGHMVPGTSLFRGPLGAPIRFVIHQVFGGEVAFRQAQVRATRQLLADIGPGVTL